MTTATINARVSGVWRCHEDEEVVVLDRTPNGRAAWIELGGKRRGPIPLTWLTAARPRFVPRRLRVERSVLG